MLENVEIIKKEMGLEIDSGLEFTRERIGKIYKGYLSFLNPIAKKLFDWFAFERAREIGLKRIHFFLEVAGKYDGKNMNELIEKNFESYLLHHEAYRRANKKHPKFEEFENSFKEEFRTRIELISPLLKAEGKTYDELVRNAYPSREKLEKLVKHQFDLVEKQINLISSSLGLIKIPRLIRKEVLIITRSAYEYGRRRIEERYDRIYGNEREK